MKAFIAFVLLSAAAVEARGQSPENVAVIINDASQDSQKIGEYYVQVRKIPAPNVIRIQTTLEDAIGPAEYLTTIERPIVEVLNREGLHDRILYLVLTKGIPLRITGTTGRSGTAASVDSELTLLYRKLTGGGGSLAGPTPNPYYLGTQPIAEAQPFTHRRNDVFLVARLDGFTVQDVIGLIDRAQTPSTAGQIVLDQRIVPKSVGDTWLAEAAVRLREQGRTVVIEDTAGPARNLENVIGYYSWGWNDVQNRVRRVGMAFVPGALAATFSSADGRTFQEPPQSWKPSQDTVDRKAQVAGSPQSLAGDLIREGVTGLSAQVSEPYLDGAVRPEILFPAYFSGFNLVESFYLAIPHLSWQGVVVGDPLCAPFKKTVLRTEDIEDALEPQTGLPGVFARWRIGVKRAAMKGAPSKAVTLAVLAEVRASRGDVDGARKALEEVVALAPQDVGSRLVLAELYDAGDRHADAITLYRQIVKIDPENVVALNNLAYSLGVRQNAPAEALPFVRRAALLAPNNPSVMDTFAWMEHLLGNHGEAARLLGPTVQNRTGNPIIHLHAAIIFEAIRENARARTQLEEALRLDPKFAARDDVKALQVRLAGKIP